MTAAEELPPPMELIELLGRWGRGERMEVHVFYPDSGSDPWLSLDEVLLSGESVGASFSRVPLCLAVIARPCSGVDDPDIAAEMNRLRP